MPLVTSIKIHLLNEAASSAHLPSVGEAASQPYQVKSDMVKIRAALLLSLLCMWISLFAWASELYLWILTQEVELCDSLRSVLFCQCTRGICLLCTVARRSHSQQPCIRAPFLHTSPDAAWATMSRKYSKVWWCDLTAAPGLRSSN